MKTMGKIITGIIIVSVIFVCIKKSKENIKKLNNVSTQTESNLESIIEEEEINETEEEENSEEEEHEISESEINETEEEEHEISESEISEINETEEKEISESEIIESEVVLGTEEELENMSVIELKELAKIQNIKGFSRMKKSDLIQSLSV